MIFSSEEFLERVVFKIVFQKMVYEPTSQFHSWEFARMSPKRSPIPRIRFACTRVKFFIWIYIFCWKSNRGSSIPIFNTNEMGAWQFFQFPFSKNPFYSNSRVWMGPGPRRHRPSH
jgi:hypothetical protein